VFFPFTLNRNSAYKIRIKKKNEYEFYFAYVFKHIFPIFIDTYEIFLFQNHIPRFWNTETRVILNSFTVLLFTAWEFIKFTAISTQSVNKCKKQKFIDMELDL